ncbi:MAG: hypothetical protein KA257_05895 [Opitutaceae bacterium]|nr:hypothetical protein [Opitutaceae bacterium]MBP9911886.1 hypothetical protein [Opitutaceae bacterium]
MTPDVQAKEKAAPPFGDVVQLAPFVVNGKKLSISIHARTPADRRYAEKFADEVVEIAYETLEDATGNGLVIIGREGEPHPITIFQKFLTMAAAGQLDPAVAAKAGELKAMLADLKTMSHMDDDRNHATTEEEAEEEPHEKQKEEKVVKLTLEMVLPALPLPLEGIGSKLYQLSWAENFNEARIEQKLRTLTVADLESDALSKYTWVFYLPPRNAFVGVQDELMKQVVLQQKLGLFKRAAVKSALFVFKPAIKKAVESMRKGVLFMTVLRAESDYRKDDIMTLSGAYMNVLMPDFKFNGGTEHQRAREAIEAQKIKNAEYAKDPFVSPPRLTEFDPTAYAAFEGEYSPTGPKPKGVFFFKRKGEIYIWQYQGRRKLVFHPAGDRLLVSSNGKLTLEFQVDETGAVTGVEQRQERRRVTFPRKMEIR